MSSIKTNEFREALLMSLEEVFANVRGFMLDKGTSMFETLATISAEEASQRVSSQGASLAAQVNHARFYIDALLAGPPAAGQPPHDWAGSWAIESVTTEEWLALIERLRVAYEKTREFAQNYDGWDAFYMAGAFGLVAHSAYHLGEIRAGISVIRDRI